LQQHEGVRSDFLEDDDAMAFLDRDGDLLADGKPQFKSLPLLLDARVRFSCKNMKQFQTEMLFNFTKKPVDANISRRQFRPYARRAIPFTRLGSPPSDAVLAMDRQASYVLCLGTKDDSHASPGLALRFFGIPSPSSFATLHRGQAPLLQCTPLLHGIGDLAGEQDVGVVAEETFFNFNGNISPVSTPVTILISNDWNMGVAVVQRKGDPHTENTGVLVLFTLPRTHCPISRVFTCQNVEVASPPCQNRLWMVNVIAKRSSSPDTIFDPLSVPGYLFCNDEGDGLRLTWAASQRFLSGSAAITTSAPSTCPFKTPPAPATKAIVTVQNSWEESLCDSMTGDLMLSDKKHKKDDQVTVVSEAYLHIDVLLADILSKRKTISERHPEFYFSVISVVGRVVYLIVVFHRRKKTCSIGVFVNVDVFTGSWEEQDWVQGKNMDPASMRIWCHRLGTDRRMRQLRAGPYTVMKNNSVDWSHLVKERKGFDYDEEDDFNEEIWKEFVAGSITGTTRYDSSCVPKLISMSSIHPDCQIVCNDALLKCEPLLSMHARDAPVQLYYG
jgi:hypothetical protein